MHRVLVVCLLVALGFFGSDLKPIEAAQDASPAATVSSPLVGAWWWENISQDPFDDSYAIFHADGTYVEETSYIGAGIGSWQATGDRDGELIIVFQDIEGGLDPDAPAAFVPGTITFWLTVQVGEDGNSLAATGPVEIRDTDGTLVNAFTFNGTAKRLGVDRSRPTGTPTA